MKELLIPGVKLFTICLAAALLLGLINAVTKGPIADAEKQTVEKALKEIKFDGERGDYLVAPPVELSKEIYEKTVLANTTDTVSKDTIQKLYTGKDENTVMLTTTLTAADIISAAAVFTAIKEYKPKGAVRAMFPLKKGDEISGFILEIWGVGYGGDIKMFGVYDKDGTVRDALILKDAETPGLGKKARDKGYMDKYIGTKTRTVPVIKAMLDNPDAVTGATITFTGVGDALRNGSRYISMFGENNEN
ncbi:MAG: FMN-binding protein [Spirochaetales bacterium]|nr:FMN-binding protein [Spirochaetales bacterium]